MYHCDRCGWQGSGPEYDRNGQGYCPNCGVILIGVRKALGFFRRVSGQRG